MDAERPAGQAQVDLAGGAVAVVLAAAPGAHPPGGHARARLVRGAPADREQAGAAGAGAEPGLLPATPGPGLAGPGLAFCAGAASGRGAQASPAARGRE